MGPFLPVLDLRNRNVQSLAEVSGCSEDFQALGLGPEIQLIAKATTGMAVVLVCHDVDDEGVRIVAASEGTETTSPISTVVKRLNVK